MRLIKITTKEMRKAKRYLAEMYTRFLQLQRSHPFLARSEDEPKLDGPFSEYEAQWKLEIRRDFERTF